MAFAGKHFGRDAASRRPSPYATGTAGLKRDTI